MWKLEKPVRTSRQTFITCIDRVKDVALKARLELVENEIVQASDDFEAAATTANLHTLVPSNGVGGRVTTAEMSDVYTLRMAKKGSPGRPIYDELLSAPAHGRCPLCGQRTVSTLDHHLPKAYYPALAVAPINLVPACMDCNKAKIDSMPHAREEETIHPYFDDVEDDLWLHAVVVETLPPALRFYVDPPNHWDGTKIARVRHHFKVLNLSRLYASQGAEELLNIRHYLKTLFSETGGDAVKTHLQDKAMSCEQARKNSWQSAAYRALSASEWYCIGGFA
jgi:hypothetical protein